MDNLLPKTQRSNMLYLIAMLILAALNLALIWQMSGLIQEERDVMDCLNVKIVDMKMIMKDFNENFKPQMEAHMKKCLFRKVEPKDVEFKLTTDTENER